MRARRGTIESTRADAVSTLVYARWAAEQLCRHAESAVLAIDASPGRIAELGRRSTAPAARRALCQRLRRLCVSLQRWMGNCSPIGPSRAIAAIVAAPIDRNGG